MTSWVLGLNGPPIGWHDAAACLVSGDGTVVAYSEEERFNRKKHSPYEPPRQSAQFCLDTAGITLADVDVVAYGWDLPHMWPRYGHTWEGEDTDRPDAGQVARLGAGRPAGPRWCSSTTTTPTPARRSTARRTRRRRSWSTTATARTSRSRSTRPPATRARSLLHSWPRSHSLGYLYDATSRACGMSFLEAGKTMGLAAYGAARGIEPWPTMRFDGELFEPPFSLDGNPDYKEVVGAWLGRVRAYGTFPVDTPPAPPGRRRGRGAHRLVGAGRRWRRRSPGWPPTPGARPASTRSAWPAASPSTARPTASCPSRSTCRRCRTTPVWRSGAAWSVCPPTGPPSELSPYLGLPIDPSDIGSTLAGAGLRARRPKPPPKRWSSGSGGAWSAPSPTGGPRSGPGRSATGRSWPCPTRSRCATTSTSARAASSGGRSPRWRSASTGGDLWPARPSLHHYMLGATQVADEHRGQRAGGRARRRHRPGADHRRGRAGGRTTSRALESAGLPPVLINTSFNTRGEPVVNTAAEALSSAQAIGVDFLVLEDQLVDLDGYSRS